MYIEFIHITTICSVNASIMSEYCGNYKLLYYFESETVAEPVTGKDIGVEVVTTFVIVVEPVTSDFAFETGATAETTVGLTQPNFNLIPSINALSAGDILNSAVSNKSSIVAGLPLAAD